MPIYHFFKARSRIGIINNPNNQKEANIGVEVGSDYILDDDFLSGFKNYSLSSFNFPIPMRILGEVYFEVLRNSILDFKKFISIEFKPNEKQIVLGGDHIVSLPSVLAVLDRIEDHSKLGYIHFDSHGDINNSNDSPSGNFHGMYLRPLFDTFDIKLIDDLVPNKISTQNLLMIGNLDLDFGEKKFIRENKIKTISSESLTKDKNKTHEQLSDFVNNFEYLHVSFDGDVLDKTIFPATGIPSENGFMLSDVMGLISIISKHPNLSLDFAEFNPRKKGSEKSLKICKKVLRGALI